MVHVCLALPTRAGFSGAQLSNLVNEAALLAARYNGDAITTHLLDEARDKILMGVPRWAKSGPRPWVLLLLLALLAAGPLSCLLHAVARCARSPALLHTRGREPAADPLSCLLHAVARCARSPALLHTRGREPAADPRGPPTPTPHPPPPHTAPPLAPLHRCRSLTQSEEARKLTAYHEGGHALVALYTEGALPIHKVSGRCQAPSFLPWLPFAWC
jgi:hypothetical protein